MKCTITRTIDAEPAEVVETEGERDQVVAELIRQYEDDSKRVVTTQAASPDLYVLDHTSLWHIEVKWEDGEVDDLILPFPKRDIEPFPEDEAEWLDVTTSLPLFGNDSYTTRFCVNGVGSEEEIQRELIQFIVGRTKLLPEGVKETIARLRLDIVAKATMPDGTSLRLGARVIDRNRHAIPDMSTLANNPNLLADILNELMADESEAE